MSYQIVGQPIPRTDNTGKVTGDTRYTSDVSLPGNFWVKTLRSPHPHVCITRIDTSRAEKAPGVRAVITGADARGILYGRRYRDITVLAQDRVRFMGDRVAAVAADTLEQVEEVLELIDVDYHELPAVLDPVCSPAGRRSHYSSGCEHLSRTAQALRATFERFRLRRLDSRRHRRGIRAIRFGR